MREHVRRTSASFRVKVASFVAGLAAGFVMGRWFYSDSEPSATDALARAMLRHSQNNAASLKREQESRHDAAEKTE